MKIKNGHFDPHDPPSLFKVTKNYPYHPPHPTTETPFCCVFEGQKIILLNSLESK